MQVAIFVDVTTAMSQIKLSSRIWQNFAHQAETLNGYILAAKAKNGYARLLWLLVSFIATAACVYYLLEAWWEFQSYSTNVRISVRYLLHVCIFAVYNGH